MINKAILLTFLVFIFPFTESSTLSRNALLILMICTSELTYEIFDILFGKAFK